MYEKRKKKKFAIKKAECFFSSSDLKVEKNERCENNHPVYYGTTNSRVAAAAAVAAEAAAAGGTGGAFATDRGVRSNRFPARPVPRLANHLLVCALVLGSDRRGIVNNIVCNFRILICIHSHNPIPDHVTVTTGVKPF